MQTFYMIIGKKNLYLYEKTEHTYEPLYIEGNDSFAYDLNMAQMCVDHLLDTLVDEYNLDSRGEIDLFVIENEDAIITNVMRRSLGEYVQKAYPIRNLLLTATRKLSRDKKLYIGEYGINFDGNNYILSGDELIKKKFSLLGYTLHEDSILKFLD